MPAADLTTAEATDIGKMCRDYGNPMIGAFAAEMAAISDIGKIFQQRYAGNERLGQSQQ